MGLGKEAAWLAVILVVVLGTMAIVSPPEGRGRLPTLDSLEASRATGCEIPVIGPMMCELRAAFLGAAAQLDTVPYR